MKRDITDGVVALLWVMGVILFVALFIINGIEFIQLILEKTNVIKFGYIFEFKYLENLILLTTAGILIYTFTINKENTESDFILKTIDNLFELTKTSIDHIPSQVKWMRAAESLVSINIFKEQLIPIHKSYFLIKKAQFVTDIMQSLEYIDASNGHRKPIEPAYFFGVKDWMENHNSFDDLYEIATENKMIVSTYSQYRSMAIPGSTNIDCRYIIAVYSFINDVLPTDTKLSDIQDWPEKMTPYIQKQPANSYIKWMKDNNKF